MSDAPGPAGSRGPGSPDEEFVVSVPTRALPVAEPTRELPTTPPVPPSPYAGWPVLPTMSGAAAPATAPTAPGATAAPDEAVDPLIGQVGVALFWVTVGWWLFFVVRLLGRVARFGFDDTMVIRTIDAGPEETIVAAVVSVAAALLLLLGRGRGGRSPIGWASLVLAVLTVSLTIWRLLP